MQGLSDTVQFYDAIAPTYDDVSCERTAYIDAVNEQTGQELWQRNASEVLDVGCGNGERSLRIASRVGLKAIHGIDISPGMVSEAQKRGLDASVANIVDIDTVPQHLIGAMDAVTCLWNVLGHIPAVSDRRQAVTNMAKLLRPGGILIVDVNNRYNAPAYGTKPALRNAITDVLHPRTAHGDFTTTKATPNGEYATTTHIFSPQELLRLMKLGKLSFNKMRFINYADGTLHRSPFAGQIFSVATKRKGL